MNGFERTVQEIATLAEKSLGDAQKRGGVDEHKDPPPYLWAKHIVKDYLFQLSVKRYNKLAKESLLKKSAASERELDMMVAPLQFLIENTDQLVDVGMAFADNYSRELLIKFFAMRLGIISNINPAKYITKTELALTRGDYLTWYLSLRKVVGGWKALGFVLMGALPEPPGLFYLHGVREMDILPDDDSVFVDVGAYIGDSALPMSQYFGKVIAFEPYEPNKVLLQKNTKGADNVEVVPYALGDVEESVNIVADTKGATGSARAVGSEDGKIKVRTMDKMLKHMDLGTHGTIKMDIEGYERRALKGGKKIIKEQLPQLVISAYHLPDDIPALVKMIEKISGEYSLYFRHHQRWGPADFIIIAKGTGRMN